MNKIIKIKGSQAGLNNKLVGLDNYPNVRSWYDNFFLNIEYPEDREQEILGIAKLISSEPLYSFNDQSEQICKLRDSGEFKVGNLYRLIEDLSHTGYTFIDEDNRINHNLPSKYFTLVLNGKIEKNDILSKDEINGKVLNLFDFTPEPLEFPPIVIEDKSYKLFDSGFTENSDGTDYYLMFNQTDDHFTLLVHMTDADCDGTVVHVSVEDMQEFDLENDDISTPNRYMDIADYKETLRYV